MIEMNFVISARKYKTFAICTIFGLIISACGVTSSPAAKSSSSQNLALALNTTHVATVSNIQLRVSITCGPWLVLTPHAATYSQSEVAAMKSFVGQNVPVPGVVDYPQQSSTTPTGFDPTTLVKLPSTLAYVPGDAACQGTYEITNTGKDLVQINKIGIQLTQPVAAFSYNYRLIDACSLAGVCACNGCGAQFICVYSSDIQMTLNSTTSVLGSLQLSNSDGTCAIPINLQAGGTVRIITTFLSPNSKKGYWYRGLPAISISSAQGNSTLTYPSMPLNLNFVNFVTHPFSTSDGQALGDISLPSPGTCYALKNNAFNLITKYQSIYDTVKQLITYTPVCV